MPAPSCSPSAQCTSACAVCSLVSYCGFGARVSAFCDQRAGEGARNPGASIARRSRIAASARWKPHYATSEQRGGGAAPGAPQCPARPSPRRTPPGSPRRHAPPRHAAPTRPSLRHARAARRLFRFHIPERVPMRPGSLPGSAQTAPFRGEIHGGGCRDLGRGQQSRQPTPLHRGPVLCGGRLPRVARPRADRRTVVRPFDGPRKRISGSDSGADPGSARRPRGGV